MTKATLQQARKWLLNLAVPFFQNVPEVTTELTVRPIAASMIKTYDASVFRDESREAVAMTLKWFREPDIRERLDSWVRINVPDGGVSLPPEAMEAPFDMPGKLWIKGFVLCANEERASVRLDTIRERAPEVFAYLARVNHQAANIVVINNWPLRTRADLAAEWDNEERVRKAARTLIAAFPDLRNTRMMFATGDSAKNDRLALICLNALMAAVLSNAPHHGPALADELGQYHTGPSVDVPPAPIPVAFSPPDDIGDILFGE